MERQAVNILYGSTSFASPNGVGTTKAMKHKARAQRKVLRLEKVMKLKERRMRMRDMGDLCRGMKGLCK